MIGEMKQEAGNLRSQTAEQVDLNRCDTEALEAIPGIGPALAQRILEYRKDKGAFLSVEEIIAVPGIGPVLYARIADQLIATPPDSEPAEKAATVPDEEALVSVDEIPIEAEVEPEAPLFSEEAPTPPPAAAPVLPSLGLRALSWLWSALLGAVLGVICTLLILTAINGSLALRNTPVIVGLGDRIEVLAARARELDSEVGELQRRLGVLEDLPGRMDSVEEAVGGLHEAVRDLNRQVTVLESRVESAEKDLVTMQAHAETVTTFFEQLQSLLFDTFGGLEPSSSSSD